MLTIPGSRSRYCDGLSRRSWLQIGGLALGGLALPDILRAEAQTGQRKRIKGIPGKFGTIRRPDGKRQVTHRGLPLYTYAHERRRQVLCDNVNGWFVIRVAKRQTSTAFTGPFT